MKVSLDRCNRLLDSGFSLIPIGDNKVPFIAWKKYQTTQITKQDFERFYNDPKCQGVGILTGFDNLEVIDVDLKVFATLPEQTEFWNEYLSFLKDNIDDFDLKFAIYKTKNQGYHILYRNANFTGNTKIAKLKGQTEAVIESRGKGGYVFVYDNQISKLSYLEIQEISDHDRDILWYISKTYNYVEEVQPVEKKVQKEYSESEIKPWVDYNDKTSIFDIIGDDFKIVRTINDKYVIKRHGGTSSHSGFVYKDSMCMFLFSTATVYPHEKLITPFAAYAYKYHNGDFTAAGAEVYRQGFGSRIARNAPEPKELPTLNESDLIFPIDIFPKPIQAYIIECNETLDSSIDYMGCSMLWLISVVIGNTIQVEVKKGWNEIATVWIAVVGKAGLGKTPSINNIIFPLQKANSKEIKHFIKQSEKYDYYMNLDKKEKEYTEEVHKPVKSQFIANDITLEALVELHQESKIAVGVFKDELNGWFKDMNKYRAGSDLEFWLSTWSGKSVSMNRKTAKSSFVDKPLIPILGGIQPGILNAAFTEENKDNGFVDRILLCFPSLQIEKYNSREMHHDTIQWYSDAIILFYDTIKRNVAKYDDEDDIEPLTAVFCDEAKVEWERIFNEITEIQNSDSENEYMKSMLPKLKGYIARFSLLIHVFDDFFCDDKKGNSLVISKASILKAEKLGKYFIAMSKKIKINNIEVQETRTVIKSLNGKTNKEKVAEIFKANPDFNRSEVSEILGISRNMVMKYLKEVKTATVNQV